MQASKYSPDVAAHLVALLRDGESKASVARTLGVSRPTLYRWMRTRPRLRRLVLEAVVIRLTA